MKIHRIWIDIGLKGDKPDYYFICEERIKDYCIKHKHEYRCWGDDEINKLLQKYPKYLNLCKHFKYGIMKADLVRWLVLYEEGGLYVDCDIIIKTDMIDTTNEIGTIYHKEKDMINNAILYSTKGNQQILDFLDTIGLSIIEKDKIDIYKKWKARYVFQTTGYKNMTRFFKDKSINHYTANKADFVKHNSVFNLDNLIEREYKNHNTDFIVLPSFGWAIKM